MCTARHQQVAIRLTESFSIFIPGAQGLLHAMMAIGAVAVSTKFAEWSESAMFFDGSSLGLLLSYPY